MNILSLCKKSPYQIFDILLASDFPANLFLKHLCVLADYGGEPIQRLGRSFSDIFKRGKKCVIDFTWNAKNFTYTFQKLPIKGLSNKKLFLDGESLLQNKKLDEIYKDMIVILMFGSTCTKNDEAGLVSCEIGSLIGNNEVLTKFVKERYIHVSRITGGATANSLGQLAQKHIAESLKKYLPKDYIVQSNGKIPLKGYDKDGGMPFDVVIQHGEKYIGVEVSFQVTTNSTIERKAGQAADRMQLMHNSGYFIAYILDGAGNFKRQSAISTICNYSDCTVAYSEEEFKVLCNWAKEVL